MAPEGSEERIMARKQLIRSAEYYVITLDKATWIERAYVVTPGLVEDVGSDELEHIADYVWRAYEARWQY